MAMREGKVSRSVRFCGEWGWSERARGWRFRGSEHFARVKVSQGWGLSVCGESEGFEQSEEWREEFEGLSKEEWWVKDYMRVKGFWKVKRIWGEWEILWVKRFQDKLMRFLKKEIIWKWHFFDGKVCISKKNCDGSKWHFFRIIVAVIKMSYYTDIYGGY